MFDLTGKTALVTGATGGIGGAIATALHAQGATVALSGTRKAVLEALAAKLGDRVACAAVQPFQRRGGRRVGAVSRESHGPGRHPRQPMPASPAIICSSS